MWQTEYNTAVLKDRVRPTHVSDKKKYSGKRLRAEASWVFGTSSVAKATPRAVTVSKS